MSPTARLASAMSKMELRSLARLAETAAQFRIRRQPLHCLRKEGRFARRHQEGVHFVFQDLRDAADP